MLSNNQGKCLNINGENENPRQILNQKLQNIKYNGSDMPQYIKIKSDSKPDKIYKKIKRRDKYRAAKSSSVQNQEEHKKSENNEIVNPFSSNERRLRFQTREHRSQEQSTLNFNAINLNDLSQGKLFRKHKTGSEQGNDDISVNSEKDKSQTPCFELRKNVTPEFQKIDTFADLEKMNLSPPPKEQRYLTEKEIIGEKFNVFWTDLTQYFPDRESQIQQFQQQFLRQKNCTRTLVIEMVGTFVRLIDPNDIEPNYKYNDQSTRQIKWQTPERDYIATVQIWPMGLLHQIQKLAKHHEIVIFTILPQDIVNEILSMIPGINMLISHILTYEHLVFSDQNGQVYKDLALLAHNRTSNFSNDPQDEQVQSEMIVLDTKDSKQCIDEELLMYCQVKNYDGQITYKNLNQLNEALKEYRINYQQ